MKKIFLAVSLFLAYTCIAQTTGYLLCNVNGTYTLPNGTVVTLVDSATYFTKYRSDTMRVNVYAALAIKAPLASPIFTGTVTLPSSTSLTTPVIGVATGTSLAATGLITSSSAITGIGYATGAGSSVTQATSKTTGVTLNTICGRITMNGAALAAAAEVSFVVTNSRVAATDVVIVNIQSVGTAGSYFVTVGAVSAGSFAITLGNASAGSLSQAVVLNFSVIKSVIN